MKLGLINEIMMALLKVFVSCSYDNQSQSYRVMKTLGARKNDDDDDHYYRPENAVFLV
jgi:hypothetical protein